MATKDDEANADSPENLRSDLVAAQEDLRQALRESGATLMSCRSRSGGLSDQIAATRAIARLIRDDEAIE